MTKFLLFGLLSMSVIAIPAPAAVCQAKSGNTTVALLELYTSEGCDSCPPADRWFAGLPERGLGPDRVVPLADLCELQRRCGSSATLHVIESRYGHDGFLKEDVQIGAILSEALDFAGGAR